MRKRSDEPYQIGKNINDLAVDNNEMDLLDLTRFSKKQHAPTNREGGFRVGTTNTGVGVHMEEGEQPGGIADQNEEDIRNFASEEFANKIKSAISAKLMGRKVNLKLKGHPDVVQQVTKMIKFESDYLDAIISGQAVDTPALQKNKALIDMEAKKLDRMLGTNDLWPFK